MITKLKTIRNASLECIKRKKTAINMMYNYNEAVHESVFTMMFDIRAFMETKTV